MKRNRRALALGAAMMLAVAMLSACGGEKDFPGTWNIYEVEMENLTLGTDEIESASGEEGLYFELAEDGTGTFQFLGETNEITWTDDGSGTATITGDGISMTAEINSDQDLVVTSTSTNVTYVCQSA